MCCPDSDRACGIISPHTSQAAMQLLDGIAIGGYPKASGQRMPSSSGPVICPRPFTLATHGYTGQVENSESFSRAGRLTVAWPKKFDCAEVDGVRFSDSRGLTASPKPNGISGGVVWRVGLMPEGARAICKYRCKLSAIQHAVHRDMQYAIGSRVALAIYLIWKTYPGLRPAIEVAHPKAFPIIPPL